MKLSQHQYDQLVHYAQSAAPHETCGVVAVDEDNVVRALMPLHNVSLNTHHYAADEADQLHAFETMYRLGLDLGAIYHSHVHEQASPSSSDIRHAYYPDALCVIVSLAEDTPVVKAWHIIDGAVTPGQLEIA